MFMPASGSSTARSASRSMSASGSTAACVTGPLPARARRPDSARARSAWRAGRSPVPGRPADDRLERSMRSAAYGRQLGDQRAADAAASLRPDRRDRVEHRAGRPGRNRRFASAIITPPARRRGEPRAHAHDGRECSCRTRRSSGSAAARRSMRDGRRDAAVSIARRRSAAGALEIVGSWRPKSISRALPRHRTDPMRRRAPAQPRRRRPPSTCDGASEKPRRSSQPSMRWSRQEACVRSAVIACRPDHLESASKRRLPTPRSRRSSRMPTSSMRRLLSPRPNSPSSTRASR